VIEALRPGKEGMEMADYKLTAGPGVMKVTGAPATLTTVVSAESWQFFAFAFAALVTLAFGVLDSLAPRMIEWLPALRAPLWSAGVKVAVFFLLGYLTLRCWPVKNFLRWVLTGIKTDSR
jgi:hypothetical protein